LKTSALMPFLLPNEQHQSTEAMNTSVAVIIFTQQFKSKKLVLKLESTLRVQTSAKNFHVLFLAVYRNRSLVNKESFKTSLDLDRDLVLGTLDPGCDPDCHKIVCSLGHTHPSKKFVKIRFCFSNLEDRQNK